MTSDRLRIIERPWAAYVILAVWKNPYSTKTQVMRLDPGNERAKFVRLQEMLEAGLMEYRSDLAGIEGLHLTDKGRAVAI